MLEQKIDDLISAIERLTTTLAQHSRVEELRTGNSKTVPVEPEQVKQPEKTKAKAKTKPEPDAQPIPTIDYLQSVALRIVRMDTDAKPRVLAAIAKHGADKLRDVPEANRRALYGDLLKLVVDVTAEQEDAV